MSDCSKSRQPAMRIPGWLELAIRKGGCSEALAYTLTKWSKGEEATPDGKLRGQILRLEQAGTDEGTRIEIGHLRKELVELEQYEDQRVEAFLRGPIGRTIFGLSAARKATARILTTTTGAITESKRGRLVGAAMEGRLFEFGSDIITFDRIVDEVLGPDPAAGRVDWGRARAGLQVIMERVTLPPHRRSERDDVLEMISAPDYPINVGIERVGTPIQIADAYNDAYLLEVARRHPGIWRLTKGKTREQLAALSKTHSDTTREDNIQRGIRPGLIEAFAETQAQGTVDEKLRVLICHIFQHDYELAGFSGRAAVRVLSDPRAPINRHVPLDYYAPRTSGSIPRMLAHWTMVDASESGFQPGSHRVSELISASMLRAVLDNPSFDMTAHRGLLDGNDEHFNDSVRHYSGGAGHGAVMEMFRERLELEA